MRATAARGKALEPRLPRVAPPKARGLNLLLAVPLCYLGGEIQKSGMGQALMDRSAAPNCWIGAKVPLCVRENTGNAEVCGFVCLIVSKPPEVVCALGAACCWLLVYWYCFSSRSVRAELSNPKVPVREGLWSESL